MAKSRMVHPTSDRHVTHVCVFDVGSDLCLICGAGSKTAGQEELEPLPEMGLSAAYKVAKEVRDRRSGALALPVADARVPRPANRRGAAADQPELVEGQAAANAARLRLPGASTRRSAGSRCRRRLGLTRGRGLRRCACSSAPRCP